MNLSTRLTKTQSWPKFKIAKMARNQTQSVKRATDLVVLYDRQLLKNSALKQWLNQFPLALPLTAGEELKTISSYEKTLKHVQRWQQQGRIKGRPHFVAVGGGSVGDFVGFLASTYQRGCRLTHVPSTWLAALDSAHGGKTALNLAGVKNQIGTFYPANEVILSRPILFSQPVERLHESIAEAVKICLVNDAPLFKQIMFTDVFVWKHLDRLVKNKLKVVQRDLFETQGVRHILNLGHTVGHVYETILQVPHGIAVALGLIFAVRWSRHRKFLKQDDYLQIMSSLLSIHGIDQYLAQAKKINPKNLEKILNQDKKKTGQKIRFIFLKSIGKVKVVNVYPQEIIQEFIRQKVQF